MTRTNRVLNGNCNVGFHSGRLHAKNILAGKVDVALTTGDGTTTVTFARSMRSANYLVLTCPQESTSNDDLCVSVSTKTPQSFVINVTSTNHSTALTVGFLILDTYNSGEATHNLPSRSGFHSGYANFRNLQWGKARITVGAGAGTALTIKLTKPMKHKPLIFASFDENDTAVTAGFVYMATGGAQTNKQFILDVAGVAGPTGTVDVTWVAFDPGFNFGTADLIGHTGSAKVEQNRQAKFGIHSGDFRAKNFVGAFMADATDGNGDGSDTITFGQMFRNKPLIFTMIQSPVNDTTGIPYASTITINSAIVGVNNSVTTTATAYFGVLAIDAEWLPTKAPESEMVT